MISKAMDFSCIKSKVDLYSLFPCEIQYFQGKVTVLKDV